MKIIQRKRIVLDVPPVAGPVGNCPASLKFAVIYERESSPPTERWSQWKIIERKSLDVMKGMPRYRNVFQIESLTLHRLTTFTEERKKLRTWVDSEQGLMGEIVEVETRSTTI